MKALVLSQQALKAHVSLQSSNISNDMMLKYIDIHMMIAAQIVNAHFRASRTEIDCGCSGNEELGDDVNQ